MITNDIYYDDRERQAPAEREAGLLARLPAQVAHARDRAPYYARTLGGIVPAAINSRAALAGLPLTRKRDLIDLQRASPPLGGLNALPVRHARRVYASPGPIYELQGQDDDPWRIARVLFAAGIRPGELIHNAYSYHFTPAAFIFEGGARKLGCPVFPAGTGQTEQQVMAISDLRPQAYVGTPSFLRLILEKAEQMNVALPSLTKACVSGEGLPAATRTWLNERGVSVRQCYATADLGAIAYESPAQEGLIVEEDVLVEIVHPGTGDPVPDGEIGEVVVTTFNADYPLLRFATGDLSAALPGTSPCGRTNHRLRGWLGRADQTTKVRGLFVHPEQIAELGKRHPEISRMRLVVDNPGGVDRMTLHCESSDPAASDPQAGQRLIEGLRDLTKLRGDIEFAPPGSLTRDGKVIDDRRVY